jgi:hypothetical protein
VRFWKEIGMGLTDRVDAEKRKASNRDYNRSPKGLARYARHRTTVKYALAQIRHEAKRRGTK